VVWRHVQGSSWVSKGDVDVWRGVEAVLYFRSNLRTRRVCKLLISSRPTRLIYPSDRHKRLTSAISATHYYPLSYPRSLHQRSRSISLAATPRSLKSLYVALCTGIGTKAGTTGDGEAYLSVSMLSCACDQHVFRRLVCLPYAAMID
jgi:hypothetical protein